MARNWAEFGSPLPGQAVSNAFSVTGFDIFAWNDPPTLSRYLAVGPARLLEMRVEGLWHNLGSVLLLTGLPISIIGLAALPWQGRDRTLRPVLLLSVVTFLVTSLVFPVATTWGTFLHASGPAQVLLVISALLALDAGLARLGRRLGWTRPVAWLGPALGIGGSLLFSAALLPNFGTSSRTTADLYSELGARMAAVGRPLDASAGPVISNFPIWIAEAQRIPALGLPDEPVDDVLDLARIVPRDPVSRADQPGESPLAVQPRPGRSRQRVLRADRPPGMDRRGDRPAGQDHRLRDRVPMSDRETGPYTPKSMEAARAGSDALDSRFDGLQAEASAAVGYSANTLRSVRERSRATHATARARWQALRDELDAVDRQAVDARPRTAADDADHPDAATAAEAGADDARSRALRTDVETLGAEVGAQQAALDKLDLAERTLSRVWLFLERGDDSLVTASSDGVLDGDLAMRIVEAQEAERSRLAQEIHDGPAQALTNADLPGRVHRADRHDGPGRGRVRDPGAPRAAPPRAWQYPRLHQPAPTTAARRAGARRRDRGDRRAAADHVRAGHHHKSGRTGRGTR